MSFADMFQTEWQKENIQDLVKIQLVDRQILDLREQLKVYPALLQEWEDRVAQKKLLLDKALSNRDTYDNQRRKLDKEIKDREEKTHKYLQQQAEVKTNKEYQALTHEIENLSVQIDKLEDNVLEILSAEEEADQLINKLEKDFNEVQQESRNEKKRIESEYQAKRDRLSKLKDHRSNIAKNIPQLLIEYYEKLFNKYPGTVLVDAKNGSCGGCHMRIIPQMLVDIRQEKGLRTCSRCLRLLIWDIQSIEKNAPNASN